MAFPFFTSITGSWTRSLAGGMLLLFTGLLLVLEPALSLTLALYSLGVVSLIVALLCLAVAAFLSRGGGLPFFLPLSLGVTLLVTSIMAFVSPAVLGGVIATIAGALFVVGGLGLAVSGAFSAASVRRRAISILLGIFLFAVGLLMIFDPGTTFPIAVRTAGGVFVCLGVVLIVDAVTAWVRERRAGPGTVDTSVR